MKRVFVIMILAVLMAASVAFAEEDPVLVYVAEMIKANVSPSTSFANGYLGMSGIMNPNKFEVGFDWRKGNEQISVMCDYTARCYNAYPVNSLEKIHCLLLILGNFENIKAMLPQGVDLSIRIFEANGNQIYITENDYEAYLSKCQEALGVVR